MTKQKSTKRALLMSGLALLMCVSMLIGSTFAWFTDSVSSTNNIIKSGNLDVELEYYDGDSWEKVTATTNVFEENTLWEPGHTEVVYLKVSNLGTLALKYQLGINIVNEIESVNVAGEALRLSDYIEFDAIDGVSTPYTDRAAARAAVTDSVVLSTGYTKAGNIEAGADAQYVALVVYMPETVGNEANYRTGEVAPQIDLGINLMATQYTSESDSFDNQYDANAMFGGVPVARVTTLAEMPVVETINNNTYTLNTAYVFNTTETYEQAQKSAYRYWHADFVATFDQDVDDAAVGLAGQYDTHSAEWLAFELSGMGDIAANTPVRMLETAGISMNYEELCNLVKEFSCGAFAVDAASMSGKTMNVELRLYETTKDPNATSGTANEETGKYVTIGTYSYTFPTVASNQPTDLPVAVVSNADEYENVEISWNTQYGIYPPAGTQLESVYTFTAQDDYDAAQNSPYADWTCDYYVTLNRDLGENQLILGGNYGSYGWIGFVAPGNIAANTSTALLQSANMTLTYEEVVQMVGTFTCGVADVNNALSGATITVELRITNPADTSEYYVINSTNYTFA